MGIRLSDGKIVPYNGEAGDLFFYSAMVMSLRSPTEASICDERDPTYACTLDRGGLWEQFVYLSGTSMHTAEESAYENFTSTRA